MKYIPDALNSSINETIFTSMSNKSLNNNNFNNNNNLNNNLINNSINLNNTSINLNNSLNNLNNSKNNNKNPIKKRKNNQSRSFLKQDDEIPNSRRLSMVSLNPFRNNEHKKTIESFSFLDSNNTNKTKLEDILEDPLLENENELLKENSYNLNLPFERNNIKYPSLTSFRSDNSQLLLQPPIISKGEYENSSISSFTRVNIDKNETENTVLPSFININSPEFNNNKVPSLYLTNNNSMNITKNTGSSEMKNINNDLFLFNMDVCCEFEYYLPHNNYRYVVEQLSKIQNFIKTLKLNLKIFKNKGQNSISTLKLVKK